MSKSWPTVKLGEVMRHRKEFITIDDLATYKRPRVQLHVQGIVQRDEVPGALIKTKTQQVCRTGEFLVAEIDAKVGGFGIVPESLNGSIVSSHYFLFVVDESKLNLRFLDYFIRTPAFREQVAAQGSTNYAAIRPAHVLGYEIPLPPLTEQRRVVARIEELAAQIAEARTLRHQAAEEAEALIKSELNLLVFKLKVEHESSILGDVTMFIGDMNHEMPSAAENGAAFISPKDFSANGTINFAGAKRISQFDFDRLSKKCRPQNGDILLARYGTVGASRMVTTDEPFLASYSIAVVRPDLRQTNTRYLNWLIGSPDVQQQVSEGIRGGIQADLGLKTIRQFRIPIPPLPEQGRIVSYLDGLQTQVDGLRRLQAETAVEVDALLPSLLDKAFKGEL